MTKAVFSARGPRMLSNSIIVLELGILGDFLSGHFLYEPYSQFGLCFLSSYWNRHASCQEEKENQEQQHLVWLQV